MSKIKIRMRQYQDFVGISEMVLNQERQKLPAARRFHDLLREIGELYDRKQRDYGSDVDPFANVRSAADWNVAPWKYCVLRINEKINRLKTLALKGTLANEGAADSFRDLAVYALIAEILFEEEKDGRGHASARKAPRKRS